MPGDPQGQGRGAVLPAQGQEGDQGGAREEGRPQLGHIALQRGSVELGGL